MDLVRLVAEVTDILSYGTMSKLLSVNRALRSQVHQHAAQIAVFRGTVSQTECTDETVEDYQQLNINLLLKHEWPCLQSLDLCGPEGKVHARTMLQLSYGNWGMLRSLHLAVAC